MMKQMVDLETPLPSETATSNCQCVFMWESKGTQLLSDAQLCTQTGVLSEFVCF